MSLYTRIEIPHHLNKSSELSSISDALFSMRKFLEALQHKKLETKNSRIASELSRISGKIRNLKNDEIQFHYFNKMESALKALNKEASDLQSLYRKLHQHVPHSHSYVAQSSMPASPLYTPPRESQGISRVVIVPKENRPYVKAFLITSYNSYLGYGNHSALYIYIEGEEPFLYDPNGGYLAGHRGSGAYFIGDEANLESFIQYHIDDGNDVLKRPLNLSPELARKIINKAINQGEEGYFSCAINVSLVLMEDYGLKDTYRQPINLDHAVKQIEQSKEAR